MNQSVIKEKYDRLQKLIEQGQDITNMLLPEDVNFSEVWTRYDQNDPGSVCGSGHEDQSLNYRDNTLLLKHSGIQSRLPLWGKVVDIGAGYNTLRSFLTPYVSYFPVDVLPRTNETIVVSGHGPLPFPDDFADCVVCANMMQHINNSTRIEYFKEIYRILLSQGTFFLSATMLDLICSPNSNGYAFTDEYIVPYIKFPELKQILQDIGFRFISIQQDTRGWASLWLTK